MTRDDWEAVQTQLAALIRGHVDAAIARSGCGVAHGTVASAEPLAVVMDGQATPVPAIGLGGTYAKGQRVAVLKQDTRRYVMGVL